MLQAALHGFILAFGLILPLGVQNIFVFNQGAVQPRFSRVLPVILTASVCDTLLITLAVAGVSVVVLGSFWIKTVLFILGILFLLYMGVVTWRSNPRPVKDEEINVLTPKKQMAFALSVSLLNPHAILDTVGVIGTSSLNYGGTAKMAFGLSCIVVSWLWFLGLGIAGNALGKIDKSGRVMALLNKISALVMWGTAIYLGTSLINQ
ncbi:LysE/ArgO family amino acid transporter [Fictibacillus enclensis]|uniref:LysE/ArgO family amino acid transporter n=1 Tax=Fictibacillus enclensis TaxID=1017270 RepID=UPI0025A0662C|nr:LysE/ArgO family amino acid transporter [Fictibacillus enclensis]MDM5197222.1 LysE/ArgO family amino acid transporter [Fictibacillus enclensis]